MSKDLNRSIAAAAEDEDLRIPVPTSTKNETAEQAAARIRAERASGERPRRLDGFNLKLQVYGEVPGFQLSIMNDDRNRIAEAQMHGWAMVDATEIKGVNANVSSYNTDPGGRVRFLVGTKDTGEPLYAYLMKLPASIWEEDQATKLAYNQRQDATLLSGKLPGEKAAAGDDGLSYVKDITKISRPRAA